MRSAKLIKYFLSLEPLRQAAALLKHRLRPRYDVIFAAGSQVDLQWVLPAYEACRVRGLECAVAGPSLNTLPHVDYINFPVQLFPFLRTRALVTATTGLRAKHMPRQANFRVAIPHSLVSFHMAYPGGAFDPYTDVFCCGEHHMAEIAAMNRLAGRTDRRPVVIGYAKADGASRASPPMALTENGNPHVLIGPSWGKNNVLELVGDNLISHLLGVGYKVTLRPHPSFFTFGDMQLTPIVEKWRGHPLFTLEDSRQESRALWSADMMISDYSGFAMEFAFMRQRPVVFVDVPTKVLNSDWQAIGLPAIELSMRDRLGVVVEPSVASIAHALEDVGSDSENWSHRILGERAHVWANFGEFAGACASELARLLDTQVRN